LASPTPRADFGLRFWPPERGPEYLAGTSEEVEGLPSFLLQAPAWRCIQSFAAQWVKPGGLLHQEIDDIFLEFDVSGPPPEIPIPAFFLDFRKEAQHRIETLKESLALLWGERLTADVEQQLMRCLDVLPAGAVLYSVGAMYSRSFRGVRLYFHHIGSEDIPAYLGRAGWEGSIDAIKGLLDWMPSGLTLCVDVGATLLPRVGVQHHIEENMKNATPMWLSFLDLLVQRGLCIPAKREALEVWLGHMHERGHRDIWPANLRAVSERLGPNVMSIFLRTINHIKVSYQPGLPLEAKGYLGFLQTWLHYEPNQRRFKLTCPRNGIPMHDLGNRSVSDGVR